MYERLRAVAGLLVPPMAFSFVELPEIRIRGETQRTSDDTHVPGLVVPIIKLVLVRSDAAPRSPEIVEHDLTTNGLQGASINVRRTTVSARPLPHASERAKEAERMTGRKYPVNLGEAVGGL